MILTFDEIRHQYLLDGKPVPSVTKVISNVTEDMMLNNSFIKAGIRGTAVHKYCEMINNGERVNISQIPEDISRYVEGYLLFLSQEKYIVEASEMRVFSGTKRFAGTMDILAKDRKGKLCVMDIKTSAVVSPTTALQLAAYEACYREMNKVPASKKIGRVCIWLTGDGKYELIHYNDPNDWNVFVCHLVVSNWRRKMGIS